MGYQPCLNCGETPKYYISDTSTTFCSRCVVHYLDAVHGYSPEFVAAAICAVEAFAELKIKVTGRYAFKTAWKGTQLMHTAMDAAIALLPKREETS